MAFAKGILSGHYIVHRVLEFSTLACELCVMVGIALVPVAVVSLLIRTRSGASTFAGVSGRRAPTSLFGLLDILS